MVDIDKNDKSLFHGDDKVKMKKRKECSDKKGRIRLINRPRIS